MIPDGQLALSLHEKYGSNEHIVEHCKAVAAISKILAEAAEARGKTVDKKVVFAAALLHDIGRNKTHEVSHGYIGAQILEAEGVDKVVTDIVRRHVGAGISREEAAKLGFPPGDYLPRSLEEKIVCFADKMVDADRARPFEQEVLRFVRKGHDVDRLRRLKEDVSSALGEDAEALVLSRFR